MDNKLKIATIILVVALATFGIAYAVNYVLQMSTPIDVTVTSGTVYIPVTLTPSAFTVSDLQTLTLTATISDTNGNGKTVRFYDGGVQVGTDQVFASEQASITLSGLSVGVHTFTAGPPP